MRSDRNGAKTKQGTAQKRSFLYCTKPTFGIIVFKFDILYSVKFRKNIHVYRRHFVYPHLSFFFVLRMRRYENLPRFALDSVYTTKSVVSCVNASGFDPGYFKPRANPG